MISSVTNFFSATLPHPFKLIEKIKTNSISILAVGIFAAAVTPLVYYYKRAKELATDSEGYPLRLSKVFSSLGFDFSKFPMMNITQGFYGPDDFRITASDMKGHAIIKFKVSDKNIGIAFHITGKSKEPLPRRGLIGNVTDYESAVESALPYKDFSGVITLYRDPLCSAEKDTDTWRVGGENHMQTFMLAALPLMQLTPGALVSSSSLATLLSQNEYWEITSPSENPDPCLISRFI